MRKHADPSDDAFDFSDVFEKIALHTVKEDRESAFSSYASFNAEDQHAGAWGLRAIGPDRMDLLHSSKDVIVIDEGAFAKGSGLSAAKPGGGGGGVLSKYVSGDAGGYNIEILFKGTWTAALQQAFITASEQLSDIIQGDVANVLVRGKVVDDIRIDASLKIIDGEGGVLGQAGPTAIRTANSLPATAVMQFDSADASALLAEGSWGDVILHEMMHSVGFGSIWDRLNLVAGADTANPLFTGANAVAAYEQLYGVVDPAGVPVEQDGGPGTAGSHWDEETFNNELMTGYLNAGTNTLSIMSVASLQDLGYDTIWA